MPRAKFFKVAALVVLLFFIYALPMGCDEEAPSSSQEDKLHVVVTLSFFEDMVNRIGGERVEVNALVPVGVEPEDYEPSPGDIRAIEDAHRFIYNGLNMERWLSQVVTDLEERDNFHALAEKRDFDVIPLPEGPFKGDPDPHLWTNVKNAKQYVEEIATVLQEADPDNEDYYEHRLEEYREELTELHQWIATQVEKIPEDQRKLITSELCFQYFAKEYGFSHDAIWPINAPEEGTTAQIVRIVEVIEKEEVPVVFVENQVDPRAMEQVSQEAGVPVGGVLYSDSLSEPGEGGETYMEMMRSNTEQIIKMLKEKGVE